MKSPARSHPRQRTVAFFLVSLAVAASISVAHAQVQIGPPPPPPTFFQEAKLNYAGSVAISADGNTAVVGRINPGDVYVFTNVGGVWSVAAQLTAQGETFWGEVLGQPGDEFGCSVATSADGGTIVVGACYADAPPGFCPSVSGGGAAYVFLRPAGGWATTSAYAAKLTNSDGQQYDRLAYSVAISGDGSTVVVGTPKPHPHYLCDQTTMLPGSPGSTYVYLRPPDSAGGWGTLSHRFEDAELTSSDGVNHDHFGSSVAISGDGGKIAVGAYEHNNWQGEAYVFVEPNDPLGWAANPHPTETSQLSAALGQAGDKFGSSIAASHDGGTIAVGAPGAFLSQGWAYVFTQPSGGWASTFQPAEAGELGSGVGGPCDFFASGLAVSGDGNTVFIGAPNEHAYVQIPANCSTFSLLDGLDPIYSSGVRALLGAVYVFTKPPSDSWAGLPTPAAKLWGPAVDDSFGALLASTNAADRIAVMADALYVFAQGPLAALSSSTLNFGSQPVGTTSAAQKVTLTNNGSESMSITVEGIDPGFRFQGGTPNCLPLSPLAPGASCDEYVVFAPTTTGPFTGTLSFQDNSGNVAGTQQTVNLSGTGVRADTTTTITADTPNPAVVGQTVTVTFSVGWGTNTFNPSGNVTVSASTGESCMGMAVVDNCTLSFSTYGTRTLTAMYAGDSHFNGSTSVPVTQNVGDFSISALPTSITIPTGGSGSSQITIASLGGFNSAVSLGVSGMPAGVSASVSPSPVTPPSGGSISSTLGVSLGPSVTPGTFSLTPSGALGSLTHSVPVGITVTATPSSTTNVINQILKAGCIDNSGVANAFSSKLAAAQSAISAGNPQLAVNILTALLNQLQAQSGKHVSTSCTIGGVTFNTATTLINDVQSMIAALKLAANPVLGYVVNSSGAGVSGATVSIVNTAGATVASAKTDATGFSFFANTAIFAGGSSYTLKVSRYQGESRLH